MDNLKQHFQNNIAYTNSNIWNLPLNTTIDLLMVEYELSNKNTMLEMNFNQIMELRKNYGFFETFKEHFNSRYESDEIKKSVECTMNDLFEVVLCKFETILEELIGNVNYDCTKVKINGNTSVVLISYTRELKDIYDKLCDVKCDFDSTINRNILIDNILVPIKLNTKGSWQTKFELSK